MKNKMLHKLMATALIVTMSVSLFACGDSATNSTEPTKETVKESTASSESTAPVEEETGITFPLKEEVTFTVAVASDADVEALLEKNAYWQELYEKTNVKMEIVTIPTTDKMGVLNALYASGSEPDCVLGGSFISETDLSIMAAEGYLMPLNEFVDNAEIMPNFNERVLADSPETKGFITTPDGNIYSLPKYTALDGNYLESPFWINKTWVDQLGKELPTTLEELEEILTLFAENDMNGNGDTTDEIPYLFMNGHATSHMEAFLGLYGIATKDSTNDSYVFIKDGVVNFAPTSDAFKDAIITLNRWYENVLIWSEAFTANTETYAAKVDAELPVVGLYTAKEKINKNEDYEYVQLAPVAVDGYEPEWYRHPGRLGGKGMFSVSASCENADILMAWIDTALYSFEGTIRAEYGEEEDGRWKTNADGSVEFISITDQVVLDDLKQNHPRLIGDVLTNLPVAYSSTDYGNKIVLSASQALFQESYEVYKDYMTDEYWPRPYYAAEDTTRLGELRTDIFNTVATKKAEWVTGKSDIESDWETFKADMDKMGIDEFIEILQKTYDVFKAGMK